MALLDLPLFVGASVIAAFGVRWAAATATWWTLLVTVGLAIYATVTREAGAGVVLMSGAAAASVVSLFLVRDGRVRTQAFLRDPLRFREADATAPVRRHVVATSVQLVLFWGAALGVVPVVIAWLERRWHLAIWLGTPIVLFGVALVAAASALGIWSTTVAGCGADSPGGALRSPRARIRLPIEHPIGCSLDERVLARRSILRPQRAVACPA